MTIKFDFVGKTVVVTGGGRGIGLEIARRFLEAGASVAVWDFADDNLQNAQKELAAFSDRAHYAQVDVSNIGDCQTAAAHLPAKMTEIDILVNNAGITRDKTFSKMSVEDFDAVIGTNLSGVFYVTKTLLPRFRAASQHNRIISIASVVALYGNFGQTNYVASKAGVIGMTKTWSRELARKGFTANAIAPGFTLTPMVELMPAESIKLIEEKIPAGRFGRASDIANACLFLASDEAAYINGAVLSVDGGLVC